MPTDLIVRIISQLTPVIGIAVVGWTVVAFTRARHGKVTGKNELPLASLQPLEQRLDRLEQSN